MSEYVLVYVTNKTMSIDLSYKIVLETPLFTCSGVSVLSNDKKYLCFYETYLDKT